VRVLDGLPGLSVQWADPGSERKGTLPAIELVARDSAAMAQLENVAKALRLAAGSLRCRWGIEVAFEQSLVFVLRVWPAGGTLRDARIDAEALAAELDRFTRLSWWRHATGTENG
jgi:hypothetical protein